MRSQLHQDRDVAGLTRMLTASEERERKYRMELVQANVLLETLQPYLRAFGIPMNGLTIDREKVMAQTMQRLETMRLPRFFELITAGIRSTLFQMFIVQLSFKYCTVGHPPDANCNAVDQAIYQDGEIISNLLHANNYSTHACIDKATRSFVEMTNSTERCRIAWYHFSGHGGVSKEGRQLDLYGRYSKSDSMDSMVSIVRGDLWRCCGNRKRTDTTSTVGSICFALK